MARADLAFLLTREKGGGVEIIKGIFHCRRLRMSLVNLRLIGHIKIFQRFNG